jgi:FtsZ-binding cell division protein ZapB
MKKFIIIVVFVFLISILISFNYLLWDREKQMESFQDMSTSKNLSIETLGEKINSLDKENKSLKDQLNSLSINNAELKDDYSLMLQEREDLRKKALEQNELLLEFKKAMDTKPVEDVLQKWIQAINKKNYSSASSYISAFSTDEKLNNLNNLKIAYQDSVKNISLKELKIYADNNDDEHISKVQFLVTLKVDVPSTSKQDYYKDGLNKKYFTMDFDRDQNRWFISVIQDTP